jgi:tetratricopeptide (TPR) repeat protein
MCEESSQKESEPVVLKLLHEARTSSSKEEREKLLGKAREELQFYLRGRANDAEANYIAGLVMYYSFCLHEEYGHETVGYLQKAVDLEPEHQFARLFLGHYYFDIGAYEQALDYFESVDEEYFLSIGQQWRVLKLHELVLCCKLTLGSPAITLSSFELLVQEFVTVDEVQVPLPLELVSTLAKTGESPVWSRVSRTHVRTLIVEMTKKRSFYEALEDLL